MHFYAIQISQTFLIFLNTHAKYVTGLVFINKIMFTKNARLRRRK